MDIKQYLHDEKQVPDFLKDFHDAKDFFKLLWEWQRDCAGMKEMAGHSWVSQHIFTMDVLLPFLALVGYRIEKIRLPKMDFYDLQAEIKKLHDREINMLSSIFKQGAAGNVEAVNSAPNKQMEPQG
jgi:hypothetical protein